MMKKIINLIITLVLFSSCASRLKVSIQIADRDSVIEASKKYPTTYNPTSSIASINKFINTWEKDDKVLNTVLSFISNKFKKSGSIDIDESVKALYKTHINSFFKEVKTLNDKATEYYKSNDLVSCNRMLNIASIKIQDFSDFYQLSNATISNSNLKTVELKNTLNTTKKDVQNGTKRTRFPILGDELASYIAKKDNDSIWDSVFNKTITSTFLGNADIAVILRSNPPERELKSGDYNNNFTLKGVRMDASDVSNAIINGLTQTVNFIANTQGLPSNVGTTPASATHPLPNENSFVTNMQSDVDKLEIKKKKLIEYKQLLLKKIELENIEEESNNEEARAKATRIINYWNGLKAELIKP